MKRTLEVRKRLRGAGSVTGVAVDEEAVVAAGERGRGTVGRVLVAGVCVAEAGEGAAVEVGTVGSLAVGMLERAAA